MYLEHDDILARVNENKSKAVDLSLNIIYVGTGTITVYHNIIMFL